MKTLQIYRIAFLFILMLGWMNVKGQQQWEVPGDNFSLEGALEIFKKSATPEEFERMLNDPDARVNNLDLNGDGYIDYIRVIDLYEGNVHTFVLQAAISEFESQDIAVITLEKLANGRAILQITGDADIYGVETIIEPTREVRTYAGYNTSRVVVNVWSWPLVRYIYGPYYTVWVSPWGWSYRPYWWSPWRPIVYYDYYSFWRPFRWRYSVCFTHRIVIAHRMYRPHRTTSVIVHNRHHHRIKNYRTTYIDREGHYQPRQSRYSGQRVDAVRYNSDGRIISENNARIRTRNSSVNGTNQSRSSAQIRTRSSSVNNSNQSRSSAQIRTRSSSVNNSNQSRSSARNESANTVQSSSRNSQRYGDNYNARIGTERSNSNARLRSSDQNSNMQRSSGRSSDNINMRRSSGNSNIRMPETRSGNGSTYRGSTGRTNVQRSSGRTSRDATLQRSQQRSGSNANIRNSPGDSNARKSFSSPSRNSGTRYSKGTSGISRSTDNRSTIQRSSSRSSSTNSRSSGRSGNSRRGGN